MSLCLCLQLMWMISINSPYSVHMVFTCTKYPWSESPFVYGILSTEYIDQVPEVPDNPRMRSISPPLPPPPHTRSQIERMNSPHTIPLSPPPVKPPLSLVARKSRTTWSWMHHIHIPPVWNLQKQVGSPSSTSFQVASRPVTVTPSVHAYIHTFDDERLKRSVRWSSYSVLRTYSVQSTKYSYEVLLCQDATQ